MRLVIICVVDALFIPWTVSKTEANAHGMLTLTLSTCNRDFVLRHFLFLGECRNPGSGQGLADYSQGLSVGHDAHDAAIAVPRSNRLIYWVSVGCGVHIPCRYVVHLSGITVSWRAE